MACLSGALSLAVLLGVSEAHAGSQRPARATEQLAEDIARFEQLGAAVVPYDVAFRRDPLRALVDDNGQRVSSSGLSGNLLVEGIIWSADHPLAVIDDELVAAGQTIGPYTVREILRDGIVVQRGEDTQVILLDRGLIDPSQPATTAPDVAVPAAPATPAAP